MERPKTLVHETGAPGGPPRGRAHLRFVEMTGPYGGRRAFRRSIAAIALVSRVSPEADMRDQVHGVGPRSSRIVG
jgi:hypothetical protein